MIKSQGDTATKVAVPMYEDISDDDDANGTITLSTSGILIMEFFRLIFDSRNQLKNFKLQ